MERLHLAAKRTIGQGVDRLAWQTSPRRQEFHTVNKQNQKQRSLGAWVYFSSKISTPSLSKTYMAYIHLLGKKVHIVPQDCKLPKGVCKSVLTTFDWAIQQSIYWLKKKKIPQLQQQVFLWSHINTLWFSVHVICWNLKTVLVVSVETTVPWLHGFYLVEWGQCEPPVSFRTSPGFVHREASSEQKPLGLRGNKQKKNMSMLYKKVY